MKVFQSVFGNVFYGAGCFMFVFETGMKDVFALMKCVSERESQVCSIAVLCGRTPLLIVVFGRLQATRRFKAFGWKDCYFTSLMRSSEW